MAACNFKVPSCVCMCVCTCALLPSSQRAPLSLCLKRLKFKRYEVFAGHLKAQIECGRACMCMYVCMCLYICTCADICLLPESAQM